MGQETVKIVTSKHQIKVQKSAGPMEWVGLKLMVLNGTVIALKLPFTLDLPSENMTYLKGYKINLVSNQCSQFTTSRWRVKPIILSVIIFPGILINISPIPVSNKNLYHLLIDLINLSVFVNY